MENTKEDVELLFEKTADYIQSKVNLLKLQAVDKTSDVLIEIFNSLGKKIKSIVLEKQQGINQVYTMSINDLESAGIYFVRAKLGDGSILGKR